MAQLASATSRWKMVEGKKKAMPRVAPFEAHHEQYEQWFERHVAAYISELLALRLVVPLEGRGIEIGVETGRFAAPLGVRVGVDPSAQMLAKAARRGVEVVAGTAEALPFAAGSFEYALVVTTICFVDSPRTMLAEAHRVLVPGRRLVKTLFGASLDIQDPGAAPRHWTMGVCRGLRRDAAVVWDVNRSRTMRRSHQRPHARQRRYGQRGQAPRAELSKQPPDPSASADSPRDSGPLDQSDRNMAHHASNCRWAVPTVFLPAPFWWDAEDRPWACIRGGTPRVLETTEVCAECPYWEPRTRGQRTAPVTMADALREVLEDTYRARATCRKVIEAFGPVQPFVTIVQAEERHALALRTVFDRCGVEAPQDTWTARVSAPDTLVEACAAAARAELERAGMYERLIPFVRDAAARRIMRRMQEASSSRYLPAFRRCFVRALRPTGRPRGVRRGRSTT